MSYDGVELQKLPPTRKIKIFTQSSLVPITHKFVGAYACSIQLGSELASIQSLELHITKTTTSYFNTTRLTLDMLNSSQLLP